MNFKQFFVAHRDEALLTDALRLVATGGPQTKNEAPRRVAAYNDARLKSGSKVMDMIFCARDGEDTFPVLHLATDCPQKPGPGCDKPWVPLISPVPAEALKGLIWGWLEQHKGQRPSEIDVWFKPLWAVVVIQHMTRDTPGYLCSIVPGWDDIHK